mgnify:CR=1 FL=1
MYKIRDINLNDDSPECKTAKEIIEAVLSYNKKVFPAMDLIPEINKLVMSGMNSAQVAYSIAKSEYEVATEEAKKESDKELKEIGFNLERDISDEDLDKWCDITAKHESKYAVGHFMYLKWISEEMMVNTSFKIIESDPKIKKILAADDTQYNKIKNDWKKCPAISKQVIALAFKLRA